MAQILSGLPGRILIRTHVLQKQEITLISRDGMQACPPLLGLLSQKLLALQVQRRLFCSHRTSLTILQERHGDQLTDTIQISCAYSRVEPIFLTTQD